jgi:hypothetical protein
MTHELRNEHAVSAVLIAPTFEQSVPVIFGTVAVARKQDLCHIVGRVVGTAW